jgi:hypothetical protein
MSCAIPQMRAIQELTSSANVPFGQVLVQLANITAKLDLIQGSVEAMNVRVAKLETCFSYAARPSQAE